MQNLMEDKIAFAVSPGNLILPTQSFPSSFHPLLIEHILSHPRIYKKQNVFSGLARITLMQHEKQGMLAIKLLCFCEVSSCSAVIFFCYRKSFAIRFLLFWANRKIKSTYYNLVSILLLSKCRVFH